nr:SMI1/KNR4 family protein [uncultured Dyadobacter sp.]
MFDTILEKVGEYNSLSINAGEPFSKLYTLTTGQISSAESISQLEARAQVVLPKDLKDFYQTIGSIKSDSLNENNSIDLFSINYLLEKLDETDNWSKMRSMGILDMILFNWGNDRDEILELSSKMTEYLNSQYIAFGWFSTDDNLESATYLYFDSNGLFGSIPYHQDDFDDLFTNYLRPMMKQSPATQTFEELIVESMDVIIELKKEELEN